MISLKSSREISIMRESCQLAASTLKYIGEKLEIGMTTEDVNALCHDYILSHDAYPSPLNYHGFPKSVCTSLNEVVCHGIPSKKEKIKNGDILNIDVTTYFKKFHGDTNRTFLIGDVDEEAEKLVNVTFDCMMAGIKTVKPGSYLGDIGAAIQELAESQGYGVVRDFCGHGIGREFHEEPQVVHVGTKGTGVQLKEGMVFTIEPMINMGTWEVDIQKDGWTVLTKDRKWSAQFEHTICVTSDGYKILTLIEEVDGPGRVKA